MTILALRRYLSRLPMIREVLSRARPAGVCYNADEVSPKSLPSVESQLAHWAELWNRPGLEHRVTIRWEPRLSASLGRCTPSRRSIRLHPGLASSPEAFLLEVVCHELAHVAAWEVHGSGIRPHGPEWRGLVLAAGYHPSTRLQPPDGVLAPTRRRRRRRRRYLYDHRCPVCRWHRVARAAVRRWRCPRCQADGLAGELDIWRATL